MNLSETVRLEIINGIMSGKYPPGTRLPSEREYAENGKISRITVRKAYEELEKAGIILRKRPGGTFVNHNFSARSGDLSAIGVITTLPHEFSGRFVEALGRCCDEADVLMVLGIPEPDTSASQLKLAMRMATRGIKDIIVWGADCNFDEKAFMRLRILGVNLVFFDQVIPGSYADYVGLDNASAVSELLRLARNARAPHYVFLNFSDLYVDSNAEREQAFSAGLAKYQLPGEVLKIRLHASRQEKDQLLEQLEALPENTAVIGVNSIILRQLFTTASKKFLLSCVDHVAQLGDLNATGYNQPITAMAEKAFSLLQDQHRKGEKWRAGQYRFKGAAVTL